MYLIHHRQFYLIYYVKPNTLKLFFFLLIYQVFLFFIFWQLKTMFKASLSTINRMLNHRGIFSPSFCVDVCICMHHICSTFSSLQQQLNLTRYHWDLIIISLNWDNLELDKIQIDNILAGFSVFDVKIRFKTFDFIFFCSKNLSPKIAEKIFYNFFICFFFYFAWIAQTSRMFILKCNETITSNCFILMGFKLHFRWKQE